MLANKIKYFYRECHALRLAASDASDASTMNYSVVVTSGVIIFSIIWYHVRGKREYQGPLIDDEVAAIMRVGSVVTL